MCGWGTSTDVHLPAGGWNGTGKPRRSGSFVIPIDSCIAPLVKALNDGGIVTTGSCCGHGKGPGRIDLVDGRVLIVHKRGSDMPSKRDLPMVTTRENFIRLLRVVGFELGSGWDHEVWCDRGSFWLHFQPGDDPFEVQGPFGDDSYRVNPDVPVVDAGAFLRFWVESREDMAFKSAVGVD